MTYVLRHKSYPSLNLLLYISGCSAAGSALDWGSRGRKFKSCHSDHKDSFSAVLAFLYRKRLRHMGKIIYPSPFSRRGASDIMQWINTGSLSANKDREDDLK